MTIQIALTYGKREFAVDVVLDDRKTLSITVHPDLRITAKAPNGFDEPTIHKRLERRTPWIAKQIDYFEQLQPFQPERQYISGETYFYLGRQYRLKIRAGDKPGVRLIGRFFEMELPDPNDRERAKVLLLDWYAAHAKALLENRVRKYLPVFRKLGAPEPKIRYRIMKKRWGSCSKKGVIMLNTELVKTPTHCIDYVVVHELCHLLHPQHNKGFRQLLSRISPDWKKRKARLERAIL